MTKPRTTKPVKVGDRFGELVVRSTVPPLPSNPNRYRFLCECDCGAMVHSDEDRLRSGESVRCKRCAQLATQDSRDRFVTDRFPELRQRERAVQLPRFDVCRRFRLKFGKYQGEELEDIAADDTGLRYLAWLVEQERLNSFVRLQLQGFLADEQVRERLAFANDHEGFLNANRMSEVEP